MTEEEKKPFWTRTYYTGSKEFRFDPNFIQEYVNRATVLVNDNQSAYYDYKRNELFPKVQNQHEQKQFIKEKGRPMNFVEFEEYLTTKTYKLFLTITKQLRDDSYRVHL